MNQYQETTQKEKALFHLPGLFEFYELYSVFLPLFFEHREYFYEWCDIGSIYGAPSDCIWGGGRVSCSDRSAQEVSHLMRRYGISSRLTFSNSLLEREHLTNRKCNLLCSVFRPEGTVPNGIIVHSDLLLQYLMENYPDFYFVSSTTKVITEEDAFLTELRRDEFSYVVPDFRLNGNLELWNRLNDRWKKKVEFLCNECCWPGCRERKACYETVSRKNLGLPYAEHYCKAPQGQRGYRFSSAMHNPGFIGLHEIQNVFLPMGYQNYKIEGRGLGSALILEFLLYYLTKPEFQIHVREAVYLDSMLDLF